MSAAGQVRFEQRPINTGLNGGNLHPDPSADQVHAMTGAYERWVRRGEDPLTDKELDRLDEEAQTAFEQAADEHRKGER